LNDVYFDIGKHTFEQVHNRKKLKFYGGGTGLCDIGLDIEMLEKSEYIEDIEHKYQKTFNELIENTIQSDILEKEELEAFIPI